MKVTIQFDTDNSAFRDFENDIDMNAIIYQLKKEFKTVEYHLAYGNELPKIRDMNGNVIGKITIEQ